MSAEIFKRERTAKPSEPTPPPVPETAEPETQALEHFPAEQLSAALKELPASADGYDRLTTLWRLYHEMLAPAWRGFLKNIEGLSLTALDRRTAELKEAKQRQEEEVKQIAAAHSEAASKCEQSISQIRARLRDFETASSAVLDALWIAAGVLLNLPKPQTELARLSDELVASKAPLPTLQDVHDTSEQYDAARRAARALPKVGDVLLESMTFYVILAVTGVLTLALWFYTGNVWIVGFVFIWGLGVAILMPQLGRARVTKAYKALLLATVLERLALERQAAVPLADLEQKLHAIDATRADAEARAKRNAISGNAHIGRHYTDAVSSALAEYLLARDACAALVSEIAQAIHDVIGKTPDLYGAFDQFGDGKALASVPLPQRTRFRVGMRAPESLAVLQEAAAERLSVNAADRRTISLDAELPVLWAFGSKRSLMFLTNHPAGDDDRAFSTCVITRILQQLPAGKANLTLFDPIGLGKNFDGFLPLGDELPELIDGKVWSDRENIRSKLKELIEHIERVTQKYLRRDYADIDAYNAVVEDIAEPYRLIALADFPEAFDEDIARDLVRVVQNGPRCGVFAIIHCNTARPMPHGVTLDPLLPYCSVLDRKSPETVQFTESGRPGPESPGIEVKLDSPPSDQRLNDTVKRYLKGAKENSGVSIAFEKMLARLEPGEDIPWSQKAVNSISVPLGPYGAKKVQRISLGKGLAHHALIVGRPGSGKSNLLHVFITTIARLYAPSEVQLYLVDFKKGVEFKAYADAKLPHARVIAVESEREFGLSVLEGLDAELKSRGERFRKKGAQNITDYRSKTDDVVPRIVLVVDEFQEFFTRGDRIHSEVAVLLDRLIRQGRAFGIHLILSSQTLANSGLEKATRDQVAIRIALQCSDNDSQLIFSDQNLQARLLTRPGEAIYNEVAGLIEGNNNFQVALLPKEDHERQLALIAETAEREGWQGPEPTIFEGHEPARIETCSQLREMRPEGGKCLRVCLGEPIALKPAVSVNLERRGGRNMAILAKDEALGVSLSIAALLSVAAQTPADGCRFAIVDLSSAGNAWSAFARTFANDVPHRADVLGRRDLRNLLTEIAKEVGRRLELDETGSPMIALAILGLQRARDLRGDGGNSSSLSFGDDAVPNLSAALLQILRDGPEVGVHTFIWCDSYNNLERIVDRSGMNELGLRVAGPLSSAESHNFLDEEVAAKIDKPFRMIAYDDDHAGVYELFRPYSIGSDEIIRDITACIRARENPERGI